jgi:hypothetical protein
MHRCLVDCPAVEIEAGLFRKRMCLTKKRQTETETSQQYRYRAQNVSKAESLDKEGYNGLTQESGNPGARKRMSNMSRMKRRMKGRMIVLLKQTKLAFTEDLLVV